MVEGLYDFVSKARLFSHALVYHIAFILFFIFS